MSRNRRCGRATHKTISRKQSAPCSNCGEYTATMYELALAELPGDVENIKWTLCVICNSHLYDVLKQHSDSFEGV